MMRWTRLRCVFIFFNTGLKIEHIYLWHFMYYKFPKLITISIGEMFFCDFEFFLFLLLPFELFADSSIKAFRLSTDTLGPIFYLQFFAPLTLCYVIVVFVIIKLRKFISNSGTLSLSPVVLSGKLDNNFSLS